MASDACYEFKKDKYIGKVESLKNSANISVCDGQYHPDHIYLSQKFTAKQDRIHFWVHDHYYDDNSGSFQVEILDFGPVHRSKISASPES